MNQNLESERTEPRLPEGWVIVDSGAPIEDIVAQCPGVFKYLED